MKIVISGANGFVGSGVANELSQDASVEICGIGRKAISNSPVKCYCQCDLRDLDAAHQIHNAFGFADVFIHFAADLSQTLTSIENNVQGTYHTLQAAKQLGCKAFIYASSLPIAECTGNIPIDENTKNKPKSLYHIAKYSAEQLLNLPEFSSMNNISLRIPAPIGKNMPDNRFLTTTVQNCLLGKPVTLYGHGNRIQNYIDIRDIAYAIKNIMKMDSIQGLYVIGGYSYSNTDVAQICKKVTKSNSDIVYLPIEDPEENNKWYVDFSKATRDFNYQPQHTLEDTIESIISSRSLKQ
ncbi:MAG TPA: NAD(P)-dependent oxidoreductase [Methanocorpusculum sp.]|jgi:nucleoside-diphosphate-sugar epimerase|nr:NAD(P)-dependent oxidoreductase [Methanocorpusculum sp.]HJJ67793.1 NAD(P)-dependent oxidoreductase [Methanocorpusculum sp.]HJJ81402.1 NAD(P)-dependent oxidoreductase [Methanocorpusculum sp.]